MTNTEQEVNMMIRTIETKYLKSIFCRFRLQEVGQTDILLYDIV